MKNKSPVLKFGKHKGERLDSVPIRYLGWLLTKYSGTSLTKEEIEKEAVRRGCEKRNGNWGICQPVGGFDPLGFGYGTMRGVVREWNYDNVDGDPDYDYNYSGIQNMD